VKTDFGEFQFGYSCTRELENGGKWLPALGMPHIPTQNEEGTYLPFDVAIGAFFLQYKVPEFLTRPNAREWGQLTPPGNYFRISIYPRSLSPQHNLMREFAKDKINVYYCTPGFSSYTEYSSHHLQQRIAERSAFIPVDQLPSNRGTDRHSVIYRIKPLQFMWCSEDGIPVKGIFGARELTRELREDPRAFGTLEELIPRLSKILGVLAESKKRGPRAEVHPRLLREVDPLPAGVKQITELATAAFSEHGLILGILSATELPGD
jgi:hypothetical protein